MAVRETLQTTASFFAVLLYACGTEEDGSDLGYTGAGDADVGAIDMGGTDSGIADLGVVGDSGLDSSVEEVGTEGQHDAGTMSNPCISVFSRECNTIHTFIKDEPPSEDYFFGRFFDATGNRLIVGIPGYPRQVDSVTRQRFGSAAVYARESDEWRREALIVPPELPPGTTPRFPTVNDVSVFEDVSAVLASGRIYLYRRSSSSWIEDGQFDIDAFGIDLVSQTRILVSRTIPGEFVTVVYERGANGSWSELETWPFPVDNISLTGRARYSDSVAANIVGVGGFSSASQIQFFRKATGTWVRDGVIERPYNGDVAVDDEDVLFFGHGNEIDAPVLQRFRREASGWELAQDVRLNGLLPRSSSESGEIALEGDKLFLNVAPDLSAPGITVVPPSAPNASLLYFERIDGRWTQRAFLGTGSSYPNRFPLLELTDGHLFASNFRDSSSPGGVRTGPGDGPRIDDSGAVLVFDVR